MHLVLNRLQLRRRLSRSLAVRRAHAIPIANSSGVAVRMLVASRVRLREARMAMLPWLPELDIDIGPEIYKLSSWLSAAAASRAVPSSSSSRQPARFRSPEIHLYSTAAYPSGGGTRRPSS